MRKELERGKDTVIDPEGLDSKAKRLDYVFFADNSEYTGQEWSIDTVEVGFTMRHPTLKCSLSDHFSIETTLTRKPASTAQSNATSKVRHLDYETYLVIQAMIDKYDLRERKQRRLRLTHFGVEIFLSIGCLIAVWWSPRNYISFILMLLSTLGLSCGVLDGLMGGLFVGSEIRALKEFEYEIHFAAEKARLLEGASTNDENVEEDVERATESALRSRDGMKDNGKLRYK
jgi:sphingomyelin phosphodiesterase 2